MSQGNQDPREVIDPLRLDRCPDCGCLFTSRPEAGRCPECGVVYDPEMIVLYGWGLGTRGNETNRYHGRTAWMLFELGLGLLLIFTFAKGLSLAGTIIPGVFFLAGAWTLYRRRRLLANAPAPVQLRLSPKGFAQRDGVGYVSLQPWGDARHFRITKRRGGRYRVRSCRWYQTFFLLGPRIDLEFKADPQVVARLCERTDRWRGTVTEHGKRPSQAVFVLVYWMAMALILGLGFVFPRVVLPLIGIVALVGVSVLLFKFRRAIWLYARYAMKGNVRGRWIVECPRCRTVGSAKPGLKGETAFVCAHCGEKLLWRADAPS